MIKVSKLSFDFGKDKKIVFTFHCFQRYTVCKVIFGLSILNAILEEFSEEGETRVLFVVGLHTDNGNQQLQQPSVNHVQDWSEGQVVD